MGECPLQNFACNLCVFTKDCKVAKTEHNTIEIYHLLQDIQARLIKLERRVS